MSISKPILPTLSLPVGNLGDAGWRTKRALAIKEAVDLACGPCQDERVFSGLYSIGDFEIGVQKPGKEAAPDYPRINENDMLPSIRYTSTYIAYEPSFGEIWRQFADLHTAWPEALLLLGGLIVRSAFMLDHRVDGPVIRYRPPEDVVECLHEWIPAMPAKDVSGKVHELPFNVFLHLLEVLALNEDVKYHTLGHKPGAVGRRNNLMTCAHVIAVCFEQAHWMDFSYALMRGKGVAPLTQARARAVFFSERDAGSTPRLGLD